MPTRAVAASPRLRARVAGVCYLITFVAAILSLVVRGGIAPAAGLIAAASGVAVTLLLYGLFAPVSRGLSLLAAGIGLAGCAVGRLGMLVRLPVPTFNASLVLFGCYCLLIGYLIFRSTFLPRVLGALMAFAGLGWLTFASPPLAGSLAPYVYAPGLLGEGALALWLLLVGVNAENWIGQANAQRARPA
jgi:hypothetical protein